MPKRNVVQRPSSEEDLKVLRNIIASKRLNAVLAKLNPNNVEGTLKKVPAGVIRLLLVVVGGGADAEKQIKTLRDDQREPLLKLSDVAKQHQVQPFVEALVAATRDNQKLAERIGFDMREAMPLTLREAKSYNTVTGVTSSPLMMLKSSRLYCEVAFFQDSQKEDKLLFNSTMELDEIIMVAERLLDSAARATDFLLDKVPRGKFNIAFRRCDDSIRSIKSHLNEFSTNLDKIASTGAKGKDSPKRGVRRLSTRS